MMCINNYDQYFSVFITTVVMSLIMSLLYIAFVLPSDMIKMQIIQCMGDDRSRAAYETCVEEVGAE